MSTGSNPFDEVTTCEEAMDLAIQIHSVSNIDTIIAYSSSIDRYYNGMSITPIKLTKTELGNLINSTDCLNECVVFKAFKDKAKDNLKLPYIVEQLSNRFVDNKFINRALDDEIESTYSVALLKYIYNNMNDDSELYLFKAITDEDEHGNLIYSLHIFCKGIMMSMFNFCESGPFIV